MALSDHATLLSLILRRKNSNCTHGHQHKTLERPSFTQNFKHQNWAIPEHEKLRM